MGAGSGPSPNEIVLHVESQKVTSCLARPFALVSYIDGKLGDFLYNLRQEIVPSCRLRSHVSLLPPRSLPGSVEEALAFVHAVSRNQAAFEVTLGPIEVFAKSNVIFVAIDKGFEPLQAMHRILNAGALSYAEPFPYHPHITLAQEIPDGEHAEALELCQARWHEYEGPRTFPVETLTFVQNKAECGWQDLTDVHLELAGSRL